MRQTYLPKPSPHNPPMPPLPLHNPFYPLLFVSSPQVCLMEHANDAVVTAAVAAATAGLYARAGINLHEAFRQAAA